MDVIPVTGSGFIVNASGANDIVVCNSQDPVGVVGTVSQTGVACNLLSLQGTCVTHRDAVAHAGPHAQEFIGDAAFCVLFAV